MPRLFGLKVFFGALLITIPLSLCGVYLIRQNAEQRLRDETENIRHAFVHAVAANPSISGDRRKMEELLSVFNGMPGIAVAFIPNPSEGNKDQTSPGTGVADGMETRFSNELKKEVYIFSSTVSTNGHGGTFQVTLDPDVVVRGKDAALWRYWGWAVASSVLLAVVAGLAVSRSFSRRIKELSGNLEELSSRFSDIPNERGTRDELELVNARTGALADRIIETIEMLKDEKEKVRAIIEQMDDGVALLDGQKRILLHNASFTAMFAPVLDAEWIGMPVREVVRNPHLLEAIDHYSNTRATVRREMVASGGGMNRHISATITPFLQDSPQKRTLLVLHDITPQRKIEEMRVDFVANASHELKTPLTAIKGFVETMADGAIEEKETARKFLGIIQKHTERLTRLVDDLLTLSNIELGREEPDFAEVLLDAVLTSIIQMFHRSAEQAGVALIHTIGAGVSAVDADRDKLLQVLINLVDNAIKYTPRGGKVEIACRKIGVTPETAAEFDYPPLDGNPLLPEAKEGWERKYAEFSVTDSGEGIPPQAIPRLMERFYRVDNARSRERGGTGLGLAIVKHILIAHRGSIRIESQLGKGTRVRFIIPLRRNPQE